VTWHLLTRGWCGVVSVSLHAGSIWTSNADLEGFTIDKKESWNKYKRCSTRSVRCANCGCGWGSYYQTPYHDDDTGALKKGQPFPCFKLVGHSPDSKPHPLLQREQVGFG
jgi:hypothetical protein